MLVSVYCIDADDAGMRRQENKQAHFDHIDTIRHKIKVAGPILGEDGKTAVSSLLIFEVEDITEAENLMQRDPYYQAGVWKELKVQHFNGVVGSWVEESN